MRNSDEVAIDHTVWLTVSTPASEAGVVQTSVEQHVPDGRVAVVVSLPLGPELDPEVVVTTSQGSWCRVSMR